MEVVPRHHHSLDQAHSSVILHYAAVFFQEADFVLVFLQLIQLFRLDERFGLTCRLDQ